MTDKRFTLSSLGQCGLLAATLVLAWPAVAQQSSSSGGTWLKPGSGRNAIGLNVGRSKFDLSCGAVGSCDDKDNYLNLYGESLFSPNFGARLGVLSMGKIDRGGGETKAYGLDLSLLGRVPFAERFSVYGKLGTTFGHTNVSAATGSGLATGSKNGFGLSYGAGLSWDFTPKLSAVVEWDSHDFKFAGGREPVRATSLGLQYRY